MKKILYILLFIACSTATFAQSGRPAYVGAYNGITYVKGYLNVAQDLRVGGLLVATMGSQSKTITSTTYTLDSTDKGKIINAASATAVTITVPPGLTDNFNCIIRQIGAGGVTLAPGSGVTIYNTHSYTKTFGKWSSLCILPIKDSANKYTTQGDMQ